MTITVYAQLQRFWDNPLRTLHALSHGEKPLAALAVSGNLVFSANFLWLTKKGLYDPRSLEINHPLGKITFYNSALLKGPACAGWYQPHNGHRAPFKW